MTQLCMRSKQSLGYNDAFMTRCKDELTLTPEMLREGEFWVFASAQIEGFVRLKATVDSSCAEVSSFFIAPESQRKGIGRMLWRKVLERTKYLGIKKLQLNSEPLSVGFYEKLGFEVVGEVPSGSIPGRMLPLMEMNVPA